MADVPPWHLLEAGTPEPPVGNAISCKRRADLIKTGEIKLHPATRVPTLRSVNYFLKDMLCVKRLLEELVDFRDNKPAVIEAIVPVLLAQMYPLCPAKRWKHIKRLIRETLQSSSKHNYYTLESTEERLRDKDYETCCALDHYTEGSFGKRFHAYIIYRFLLFMRVKSERVSDAFEANATCVICLERAASAKEEGGRHVEWRQAEPCRHWTCGACTRDLISNGKGRECQQCQSAIITYAFAFAPAANR